MQRACFDSSLYERVMSHVQRAGFDSWLFHICSVIIRLRILCGACQSRLRARGTQGFKKKESYVQRACFDSSLKERVMCSVLVSSHGFKNELCYMCSGLYRLTTLRTSYMLHVQRASLDLGLKGRVMLQVQCACFGSWHDQNSGDCIRIDVFPMDPIDSIGRLSNSPQLKVLFTLPVLSYDQTSGDSSGLDCTSGFIARLYSTGLRAASSC